MTIGEAGTAVTSAPAGGYSQEYYDARGGPMFRLEIRHLLALAAPSRDDRVLELGCGAGLLLAACHRERRASLTMGVDVNHTAVSLASRVAPVALADATRLPLASGSFQAVVAQHLIEHFERPEEALREWYRVLAPGGRVVVATPNAAYPDPALFDDPTHHHVYLLHELRRLFEESGFRVERCYTLMPFLGNRRLTWAATKLFGGALPALRFLPYFRTRGLTLFLSATKRERPERREGDDE
ncbi:MAG: class I SAM-dependent methyltransferase [Dehalococcoidia bacterium]|nr:class I SAM-dependent methyltransferase [Dehalococcoidia bacterium]